MSRVAFRRWASASFRNLRRGEKHIYHITSMGRRLELEAREFNDQGLSFFFVEFRVYQNRKLKMSLCSRGETPHFELIMDVVENFFFEPKANK